MGCRCCVWYGVVFMYVHFCVVLCRGGFVIDIISRGLCTFWGGIVGDGGGEGHARACVAFVGVIEFQTRVIRDYYGCGCGHFSNGVIVGIRTFVVRGGGGGGAIRCVNGGSAVHGVCGEMVY